MQVHRITRVAGLQPYESIPQTPCPDKGIYILIHEVIRRRHAPFFPLNLVEVDSVDVDVTTSFEAFHELPTRILENGMSITNKNRVERESEDFADFQRRSCRVFQFIVR